MNPSLADADSRSALVDGDSEAVDEFVARVLRQAHQSAEARNAAAEARTILGLAHLFADELTAGDPGFDRLGFVTAATDGPS
jgi:hypothetical protein